MLGFVGHYAPDSRALDPASSAAGNQVQREIVAELREASSPEPTFAISMTPRPAWPRGPVILKRVNEPGATFPTLLNLPVLKHAAFALGTFVELLRARPRICVQYNAYVFENLALLAYRRLFRGSRIAIVVQDIHTAPGRLRLRGASLRSLSEKLAIRLARGFDLAVPVSAEIVRDFGFTPQRCMVFPGGVTRFARELAEVAEDAPLDDIAVIAGALEPYNGVDLLVRRWLDGDAPGVLHVFGRGSLAKAVEEAAERSDHVVFHGLQSESVVIDWQRRARWNFCLRYGVGLTETYFFPSKLFNVLCAPGVPVANAFRGLPDLLHPHLCLVEDGLADLPARLRASNEVRTAEAVRARRAIVASTYSWTACVQEMLTRLAQPAHA
jgi:hypothetical protein